MRESKVNEKHSLPIILASKSPRRSQVLRQVGIDFMVMESAFKEKSLQKASVSKVKKLVMYNALEKAKEVAERINSDAVFIGVDTLVVCEDRILGKPKNEKDAMKMLLFLNRKEHNVVSGICVIRRVKGKQVAVCDFEATVVYPRKATRQEIQQYVKTKEPLDKAGGYGIQEKGALFIARIEGEYYNVVGLPLIKLVNIFKQLNINFWLTQ